MTDCISGYISLGTDRLHYLKIGSGKRVLVTFHGYGNDTNIFSGLCDACGREFTCINIDLPHHGKSEWGDNKITEEQIVLLVKELIAQFNVDKVSLLGYSIGGRVCLKLTELIPEAIDKVVLLASDGLRFNSFYYFLTSTMSGKSLFTSFLKNPKPYNGFIEIARKLGVINTMRYNFAMRYIRAENDREFLLKVWPCMSLLIPDINKLKLIVTQYHIELGVFMGKHDAVIPLSLGIGFKKNIPSADLIILDKGHKLLDADTIPVIAKYLHST
jgi:pimeloyl-ACP methyl ester carboxylesterase